MSNGRGPVPGQQSVSIPAVVVAQIQMQTVNSIANAIVQGDYEGAEVIPMSHKKIIGEMLITLTRNRALETAKCEHCSQIRLEHSLDLVSGDRLCAPEFQPKPNLDDLTLVPAPKTFRPMMQQIVAPTPDDKRIILAKG